MRYAESGITKNEGRLDTPAFHRNHKFVAEVLGQHLSTTTGDVLELASGSGQHVVVFAKALPNLTFWPSDLEAEQVQSIIAWRQESDCANIKNAFQLNVTDQNWGFGEPNKPPQNLAAIINLNMVHISPIEVAKNLFRGAGQYLQADGRLFLYGPFKHDGRHNSAGNAQFDDNLRRQNPEWGVRDIKELEAFAADNGLALNKTIDMPANNFTLVFGRATARA
ncbi:MAG: DUF938 domain-containing protein [Rhodospirillaceae bacterium]|nr:DUF938 domain-containing protein [Rhodospirillaceae bacterium]